MTMNLNSTKSKIRPRRIICNLTSDFCLLISGFMPNKPNFQPSRLSITLDKIRTYNDNLPEKRKKNKPKTHQKRTKTEPIRTKTSQFPPQKQPPQTQFFRISSASHPHQLGILHHQRLSLTRLKPHHNDTIGPQIMKFFHHTNPEFRMRNHLPRRKHIAPVLG